jgi:hypothetical protein
VSKGRNYLSRGKLVETVRERLRKVDAREGADAEQGSERATQAARQGDATGQAVGQGRSGDGPQLSLVRRRNSFTRRVSEVSLVTPDDVRHVCSWCARSVAKPLPPLLVEHRRSGVEHGLHLCAFCSAPSASVWTVFRRPREPGAAA